MKLEEMKTEKKDRMKSILPREQIRENISEGIGDLLFPFVQIAHHYGISLEKVFMTHYEKLKVRYSKDKLEEI